MSAKRTPTALATLDADGSAQYVFDIDWHARQHARGRRLSEQPFDN